MAQRLILIVQRRSGLAQPRKRRDLKWWWSNGWVQVSPAPKMINAMVEFSVSYDIISLIAFQVD
jgi:hypothetical protein